MSDHNTNSTTESNITTKIRSKGKIECSIRRRPGQVGLPGSNPSERVYKVGSSISTRTKGALKGVSGLLEKKLMPEVVGVAPTDYNFRQAVEEYWSDIGVPIPPDETHLKESEKGRVLKIVFFVSNAVTKEELKNASGIEEKVKILSKGIEQDKVELETQSIADFLLLSYCLLYSRVANRYEDIEKSVKIWFYIYNKTTEVKSKLTGIKLRNEAVNLFQKIQDDVKKIDAVLILFEKEPWTYEDIREKVIAVDEEIYKNSTNTNKFVEYVKDSDWETIYLIKMATKKGKLTNPVNTETYYYNEILLGRTIKEAVLFLNSNVEEASNIKLTLEREIKT